VAKSADRALAILADLQGPKIRLGRFEDGPHEWPTADLTTDGGVESGKLARAVHEFGGYPAANASACQGSNYLAAFWSQNLAVQHSYDHVSVDSRVDGRNLRAVTMRKCAPECSLRGGQNNSTRTDERPNSSNPPAGSSPPRPDPGTVTSKALSASPH